MAVCCSCARCGCTEWTSFLEPADVGGQCSRPVALLLRLSRARVHLGARDRLTTGRLDLFALHRHVSPLDFAFGCRRLALMRSAPLGAQAGPECARWPPWKMQRPPLRCLSYCTRGAIASGALHRMPSSIFAMLYLAFRLCVSLLTQWGPTLLLLQYRILEAPASAETASRMGAATTHAGSSDLWDRVKHPCEYLATMRHQAEDISTWDRAKALARTRNQAKDTSTWGSCEIPRDESNS